MNKLLIALFISALGVSGASFAETSHDGKKETTAKSKTDTKNDSNSTHREKHSNPAGTNLTGNQSQTREMTSDKGTGATSPAEKSLGLGDTGKRLGGPGSK